MKVSIRDVAKKAGVSISTVSMVLNGKDSRISKKTSLKVKEIARELNYFPNAIARSLVGTKTRVIGLVIPDLMNIFYNEMSQKIISTAEGRGYNVIIIEEQNSIEKTQKLLNTNLLSGAILLSNFSDIEQLQSLEKLYPIVFLDDVNLDLTTNYLTSDNYMGGKLVASYLLETNHKKFIAIGGSSKSYNSVYRLKAFRDTLIGAGINEADIIEIESDYTYHGGYHSIMDIYEIEKGTGIFCANDIMAYGAIQALKERSIAISKDGVSIIGYDNLRAGYYIRKDMATVDQRLDILAVKAVNLVMDIIENKKVPFVKDIETPELIRGNTVFRR